jgi:leader peptidase (prepilin peptidase)/N-methyltransferase
MAWIYVALVAVTGCLASLWLRRRTYRRQDDTVLRELNPWWVPATALTGAVAAGPFFADRVPLVVVTYALALVWGVVLGFIDLEVRRLPDALVLPAFAAVAALLVLCSAETHDWTALLRAVASAGAATAAFLLAALFSPGGEGLGLGDVKLAGVLGGLLGWFSWSAAALGLLTGFVFGGLAALVLVLTRRAGRKSDMTFGPALILGAYVWCLLSVNI